MSENYPYLISSGRGKAAENIRHQAETARIDALQDLFVFGYECTVFRDDERAEFIEEGHHLIPWMGDETNMVDRYDGRGYISDLTEYDADLNSELIEPLTDEERHIEALCDEERYFELQTDVMEKMLYEEEELKRLNEALADSSYGAVGFSYDSTYNEEGAQIPSDEAVVEDDETAPFVPTPALLLPPGIITPPTMKVHAIIEKTALFISKQGVQMEIMMKAKQKDNPQFQFLSYEDELNAYYQHLVKILRSGKYVPDLKNSVAEQNGTLPEPEEIMESTHISSEDFLDSIQSKLPAGQIANTSYALLLSNLSRHTVKPAPLPEPLPEPVVEKSVKPMTSKSSTRNQSKPVISRTQPNSKLLGPSASLFNTSSDSSSDENGTVTVFSSSTSLPHRQHTTTTTTNRQHPTTTTANERPGNNESGYPNSRLTESEPTELSHRPSVTQYLDPLPAPKPEAVKPVALPIIPPSPDMQPIIDKMANFVARNGPEFEAVVKLKNDPRFCFIEPLHVHHTYYEYKKNIFIKEFADQKLQQEKEEEAAAKLEEARKKAEQLEAAAKAAANKITGVSFSIKTKDDEAPPSLKNRVMLDESSSEEEDGSTCSNSELEQRSEPNGRNIDPSVRKVGQTVVASLPGALPNAGIYLPRSESTPLLELEKKHADTKLADRLSAAARERVSAAARERQLQVQRKRKAALFASMLKHSTIDSAAMETANEDIFLPTETGDRSRSSTPNVAIFTLQQSNPTSLRSSPAVHQSSVSRTCSPATSLVGPDYPMSPAVTAVDGSSPVVPPPTQGSEAVSTRHRAKKSKHSHSSHSRSSARHRSRSRSPHHKKHKKRVKTPSSSSLKVVHRSVSKSPVRHKSKTHHADLPRHVSSKVTSEASTRKRSRSPNGKTSERHGDVRSSKDQAHKSRKHKKKSRRSERKRSDSSDDSTESSSPVKKSRVAASSLGVRKTDKLQHMNRSCSPISIGDSDDEPEMIDLDPVEKSSKVKSTNSSRNRH